MIEPDATSGAGEEATALICSAKGCQDPATMALRWNNPKIHAPDRRKTWLACAAHVASLSEFLGARGFLRDTEPIDSTKT